MKLERAQPIFDPQRWVVRNLNGAPYPKFFHCPAGWRIRSLFPSGQGRKSVLSNISQGFGTRSGGNPPNGAPIQNPSPATSPLPRLPRWGTFRKSRRRRLPGAVGDRPAHPLAGGYWKGVQHHLSKGPLPPISRKKVGTSAYVPLAWPWVDHSASGQRGETVPVAHR